MNKIVVFRGFYSSFFFSVQNSCSTARLVNPRLSRVIVKTGTVDFHYHRDGISGLSKWMNDNVKHWGFVYNLSSGYRGVDDDDDDDDDNGDADTDAQEAANAAATDGDDHDNYSDYFVNDVVVVVVEMVINDDKEIGDNNYFNYPFDSQTSHAAHIVVTSFKLESIRKRPHDWFLLTSVSEASCESSPHTLSK